MASHRWKESFVLPSPRLGRLPVHMQGLPLPPAPGSSPNPAAISVASGAPRGSGLHRSSGNSYPIIPHAGRMLSPTRLLLGTEAERAGVPLFPTRAISLSPLGLGSRSRCDADGAGGGGEGTCYGSSGAWGWDS